jgi:hypothetical protein
MNNMEERETGLAGSDDRAGDPILFGRKSVLMGVAASVGVALANATLPSSAMAAGTVKPIAASQNPYAPKWTPSTAYALGQQIISPKNDVVAANAAHSSSATFTADEAKWTLSSTFARATVGTAGLLTSSLIVETSTGVWSGDAPARTPGQYPIIFSGTSDPADPTHGIATPARITGGDIWLKKL